MYYTSVLFIWMQSALRELTSRDSFCAPEIDIFRAIQQWAERNVDLVTSSAMSTVRLPLIKLDDLLNVVRLSSLVSADAILDAIKLKTECKDMELDYRGFLSSYHFCSCCVLCSDFMDMLWRLISRRIIITVRCTVYLSITAIIHCVFCILLHIYNNNTSVQ